MKHEVGMRVGVLREANETTVYLYGYGTYEGEKIPDGTGPVAEALRLADCPVTVLRLDSGEAVYGFECWWADEETVRRVIGDREVVQVSVKEDRENSMKEFLGFMAEASEESDG